jgi:gluconate 2-dehydrogenase gamma chain
MELHPALPIERAGAPAGIGMRFHRRDLLTGTAILLLSSLSARASVIEGALPWQPNAGAPPEPVKAGPWHFFTGDEGRAVEALADRVIPPDAQTAGGKDAGCAVFVDRQLAGAYGRQEGLYLRPPFMKGTKEQGPQSEGGYTKLYRDGLAALDLACKAKFAGRSFAELPDDNKDNVLKGLESGDIMLDGVDGADFFAQVIKDTQQGFFADPLYGGNRDMCAWAMIGYPGARYNYLDWIDRHNERFPLPPVSITGRTAWTPKAH